MLKYWNAIEGRLLMFSLGLLLVSGGLAAILGFTPLGIALLCIGEIVTPTIALFGVGLGTWHFLRKTVLGCIALPALFFVFVVVQGLAMRYWPALGYGLLGAGLVPLVRSFQGTLTEELVADLRMPLHQHA